MSSTESANTTTNEADADSNIGTEMNGVFGISYTLNSCARHGKFAHSSRIS